MKWNIHDDAFELDRIAVPTDHCRDEISTLLLHRSKALDGNELYWFNERAELMRTNIDA